MVRSPAAGQESRQHNLFLLNKSTEISSISLYLISAAILQFTTGDDSDLSARDCLSEVRAGLAEITTGSEEDRLLSRLNT